MSEVEDSSGQCSPSTTPTTPPRPQSVNIQSTVSHPVPGSSTSTACAGNGNSLSVPVQHLVQVRIFLLFNSLVDKNIFFNIFI